MLFAGASHAALTLQWADTYNNPTFNSTDAGFGTAVDGSGNVYVVGTSSVGSENYNIWVRKYNSAGTILWTTTYNSPASGDDIGQGIAVDGSGNAYVTGYETRNDLVQGENIWVRKYDTTGLVLWTTTYNGPTNSQDDGRGIAVDGSGNAYVVGTTSAGSQGFDIWVRKYDTNGLVLWTTTYNGSANGGDEGWGIAVDASGNAYVTGTYGAATSGDIWVAKYNTSGVVQWTTSYNGTGSGGDQGRGIAVDGSGNNVYVTGAEQGASSKDIWVRKYDTNGLVLWTTTYNGAANLSDEGRGVALDVDGYAYVTGFETVTAQGNNIWVRKYDFSGLVLWTTTYNSSGNLSDQGQGIAVDGNGNAIVAGYEDRADLGQGYNVWVRKWNQPPPAAPTGLGAADVPGDQGGALRLNWTANTESDLKDYRIRRSTGPGITGAPVAATVAAPGTTHQDSSLGNGTTFYYRMTARDTSLVESAISAADVSAYPVDNLAPAAPTGLAAADAPADQGFALRLNWTANTEGDVKDYQIRRSTGAAMITAATAVLVTVTQSGTTHQDAGLANNATYYYRLTARDTSLNESGLSSELFAYPVDNLAPAAPTGLAPISVNGSVKLYWAGSTETDLKDYRVFRSTNAGVTQVSSHVVVVIASPGTTHQDGGLTNGTTYYYRLTARDTVPNESGLSSEVSGNPDANADVIAPSSPTAVVVADVPVDQGFALRLNWTASTDNVAVKDYAVYRATFTGAFVTKVQLARVASPGTTHQDGGLTNGATFYYQLTARDTNNNESAGSAEVSTVPYDNLVPSSPTAFGVSNPALGGVLRSSWTANTELDLKDYGVYRAVASGALGTKTLITRIAQPGTTHQDGALANGTTYYYQLTVRDASLNESAGSTEVSGVPTDLVAPAAPAWANLSAGGSGALNVYWMSNTESDLKDYRVLRSTLSGGLVLSTATILAPGTTHQDAGLTNGTTYYYRVTARDQSLNESAGTAEVSGYPSTDQTAPSFPFGLGVSNLVSATGGALKLSWLANGETDLKDYGVYRATWTSATQYKVLVTRIAKPGTTHQDAALTNGSTYYYQVTARDSSLNESAAFGEASAYPRANTAPNTPSQVNPPDGTTVTNGAFTLQMGATDPDGDGLAYAVTFSTAANMSKTSGVAYSSAAVLSFTTYTVTSPFYKIAQGSTATFTHSFFDGLILNNAATYYWNVSAWDGVAQTGVSGTRSFFLNVPPQISAVTGVSVTTGTSVIVITGTYLHPLTQVTVGGIVASAAATVTIPGFIESITATVTGLPAGTHSVTVVTTAGQATVANAVTLSASFVAVGTTVTVVGTGTQVFSVGGSTVGITFSGLPSVNMSFSTAGVFSMSGLNFAAMTTSATITMPGLGITIPPNLFPGVTNATMRVSTNPATSPINPQVPTIMAAANTMQSQGNAQQAMPQPIDGGQREISWFDDTGNALAEAAQKGIAEIKIFYPDANNDKRIDGTKGFQTRGTGQMATITRNLFGGVDFPLEDVPADDTHMIGCFLKGTGKLGQWSDPFPTKVDTVNKCMVFQTQHFSVFTLMAAAPALTLDGLMVYPNPYNPTSAPISDIDPAINGTLKFQGLTADAKIRIFNLTGELVVEMAPGYAVGKAVSPGAGRAEWDGLNTDGEAAARGLYFYIVDSSTGRKRGKIAVLK